MSDLQKPLEACFDGEILHSLHMTPAQVKYAANDIERFVDSLMSWREGIQMFDCAALEASSFRTNMMSYSLDTLEVTENAIDIAAQYLPSPALGAAQFLIEHGTTQ